MRAIGVILGIAVAAALVYGLLLRGAPERGGGVEQTARAAVEALATHPVEVAFENGRPVLRGFVDSAAQRAALLAAVARIDGIGVPVDRLDILPRVDAYRFSAAFGPEPTLRLEGHAPSAAAKTRIADAARAAALRLAAARGGEQTVEVALDDAVTLAAGAPDRWAERVSAGLDALSQLTRGELAIDAETTRLTGIAASEPALAAVQAATERDPARWDLSVTVFRPTVAPFTLTVLGPGAEATADETALLSRLGGNLGAEGGAPALTAPEQWRVFGHAPDAAARERIVDSLSAVTETAPAAAIALADGAPNADWVDFVVAAMGGLPLADAPRLEIADAEARLSGLVDTPEAAEALVAAFAPETPAGYDGVSLDVAPRDPRRAAALDITGMSGGERRAEGRLPEGIELNAGALAVFAGLVDAPRDGRGDADLWARALAALAAAALQTDPFDARLLAVGEGLNLTVSTEAARRALARRLDGAGLSDRVDLRVDPDALAAERFATLAAEPETARPAGTDAAAPGAAASGAAALEPATAAAGGAQVSSKPASPGEDAPSPAADAASEPDIAAAGAALGDGAAPIVGDAPDSAAVALAPPAPPAPPADMPAAPPALAAPPPPSPGVTISLSADDGLRIDGVLPEGLDKDAAFAALGISQAAGALETGARGDATAWRRNLAALGELLGEFEQLDAAIAPGRTVFEGQTLERSDAGQVRALLSAGFADQSPRIDVAPTAVAYPEGAERRNPVTGRRETLRRGYWLPEVEVADDVDGCRRAADLVLLTNEIRFRFDSTALDVRARSVINELSAIALECLPSEPLASAALAPAAPVSAAPIMATEPPGAAPRPASAAAGAIIALEIGGHTDSLGPESYNQLLSQRRSAAVRRALIARGMAEGRLVARGFGETAPLVANDSRANRRQNRRITFEWIREPSPQ